MGKQIGSGKLARFAANNRVLDKPRLSTRSNHKKIEPTARLSTRSGHSIFASANSATTWRDYNSTGLLELLQFHPHFT